MFITSLLIMFFGLGIFIVTTIEADQTQGDLMLLCITAIFGLIIMAVGGLLIKLASEKNDEVDK